MIKAFDGLVNAQERDVMYQFVSRSLYQIGWSDTVTIENKGYNYLHSAFSPEDFARLGLESIFARSPELLGLIGDRKYSRCVVNLSTPSDVHFPHVHAPGEAALIYYANPDWRPEWYGETLFFNDDLSEIICAIAYKPGRIVFAEAGVPHSIRPQSAHARHYRFTVGVFYK